MSALLLELASAPLEAVAAELAVVACFAEDRPLRGGAGRADWRLCGVLSQLVAAGWLRCAAGEAALVPSGGGIAAPRVMALGLGGRVDFDRDALARFAAEALRRAELLRARSLALGWPERLRIAPSQQLDALLAALGEAGGAGRRLERVWLCASAAETAALAEALRGRGDALPAGVALGAPLAAADRRAGATSAGSAAAPPIARMRIK